MELVQDPRPGINWAMTAVIVILWGYAIILLVDVSE
jgi:hypothetical protein